MPNVHHYTQQTNLPYITNANVTETRPHYVAGQNVLSSLKGYVEKRYGNPTYTTDIFNGSVQRLFGWRRWSGAFFVMASVTTSSQSKVYKLQIGTDTTFQSIFTSSSTTAFDFTVSNNQVYFGNSTDMEKYDGTTVTKWGIAKPAAAPNASQGAGSISAAAGDTVTVTLLEIPRPRISGRCRTPRPTLAISPRKTTRLRARRHPILK